MSSKLPDEAKAARDAASTRAAQRKLFLKIVWRSRDYQNLSQNFRPGLIS